MLLTVRTVPGTRLGARNADVNKMWPCPGRAHSPMWAVNMMNKRRRDSLPQHTNLPEEVTFEQG